MANGTEEEKAFFAGQQAARIEALFSDVDEIKCAVRRIESSHEKRIARLERWRSWLTGAMALLAGLLGLNQHFGK